MSELHVYKSECDWYIATSMEDAWNQLAEHLGEPLDEVKAFDRMDLLPDDKPITMLCERDLDGVLRPSDNGTRITKTAAEWAAQEGRGQLGSTEY